MLPAGGLFYVPLVNDKVALGLAAGPGLIGFQMHDLAAGIARVRDGLAVRIRQGHLPPPFVVRVADGFPDCIMGDGQLQIADVVGVAPGDGGIDRLAQVAV